MTKCFVIISYVYLCVSNAGNIMDPKLFETNKSLKARPSAVSVHALVLLPGVRAVQVAESLLEL